MLIFFSFPFYFWFSACSMTGTVSERTGTFACLNRICGVYYTNNNSNDKRLLGGQVDSLRASCN